MLPSSPTPRNESLIADLVSNFGALPDQLVYSGLADGRALRYLDVFDQSDWTPVVLERDNMARVLVVDDDGRQPERYWAARIAGRGDAAWVAVRRGGTLHVYQPTVAKNGDFGAQVWQADGDGAYDMRALVPALLARAPTDNAAEQYRKRLVDLLTESATALRERFGVSPDVALALVGRALFWRFIVDRKITPRDLTQIAPGAASAQDCLAKRQHAIATFDWLDRRFNGGLLPIDSAVVAALPEGVFGNVLSSIAYDATASGQLSLPADWAQVNFRHIPVGLLGEVYEAFAHRIDSEGAKEQSIHYTPRHIAEFVVGNVFADFPAEAPLRVLDPACGAGVFLITAFRQLVERAWQGGQRPDRKVIRRILNEQLCGFDIDDNALRLAELGLYLTALELDGDAGDGSDLKFEPLRGLVLRNVSDNKTANGTVLGSLGSVAPADRGAFDVVVGNPPWTAKKTGRTAKAAWEQHSRGEVAARLGASRAKAFKLPDTNPDLPFVWRAMQWAKPGEAGAIGLVLHARWLFNTGADDTRRDLLESLRVSAIVNGARLRLTEVWPNVSAPFSILFARNERPGPRTALRWVSPAIEGPDPLRQRRLRIDWAQVNLISHRSAAANPRLFKTSFRGTALAESTLREMARDRPQLSAYLASLRAKLSSGFVLGGNPTRRRASAHLEGLQEFRPARKSVHFVVDTDRDTVPFDRRALHTPNERDQYDAPLLLIRECIPAQRSSPQSVLALADTLYSESYFGISLANTGDEGEATARYLQLLLQSSVFLFFALMTDATYGVERDVIRKPCVEALPVPPHGSLPASERDRGARLSARLHRAAADAALLAEIDEFSFDVYGLRDPARQCIRDALSYDLPGSATSAISMTTAVRRQAFVAEMSAIANSLLSAIGQQLIAREFQSRQLPGWRALQVDIVGSAELEPPVVGSAWNEGFAAAADDQGCSIVRVQLGRDSQVVALLDEQQYWSLSRAHILAMDILYTRGDHG